MKSRIVASVLVSYGDKYIFITQDKPDGAYPDTLHLPGGGLEPGETPIAAAIREIREEVGLEVVNILPVDFDWDIVPYKGELTLLIYLRFKAEATNDNAVPGSDAQEAIWVARKDLAEQRHNDPSRRLLQKLQLI